MTPPISDSFDPVVIEEPPSSAAARSFRQRGHRTLRSEADAARAKRDRRIEQAVESAVMRRAEREAKSLGTDAETVARRLREQRVEAVRWREMEEAKTRIARDRFRRETSALTASTGRTSSIRSSSSTGRASYRSTRSSTSAAASDHHSEREPALSGWLADKMRGDKGSRSTSAKRSTSRISRTSTSRSASASASSWSPSKDRTRSTSSLRASSRSRGDRQSLSVRSRERSVISNLSHNHDDDAATIGTEGSFRSLKSSGSIGKKIRSLNFHRSSSRSSRDASNIENDPNRSSTRASTSRSKDRRLRSSKSNSMDDDNISMRSSRTTRSVRSKSKDRDDVSVRSSRSTKSKSKSKQSTRSKNNDLHNDDDDNVSLKSSRSIRSLLKARKHHEDDDDAKSIKTSRSSRSRQSKSRSRRDRDDQSVRSSRSKDIKITRHSRRRSAERSDYDSHDLYPSFYQDREEPSNDVRATLEGVIVRLKLEIADARSEEETERHHARRVAEVNDRLRSLHEQQKYRTKKAEKEIERFTKELDRMRKLKAKIAPQIKEGRVRAWQSQRRSDSRPRSTSRHASKSSFRKQSYHSGTSVSSWSLGESLPSVQSLFERVERGIIGLEDEAAASQELSENH